jgi:hypothetical protein
LNLAVFPPGVNLFLKGNHPTGKPIGDHTDSNQAESFQLSDSIGQGLHDRNLCTSRLLDPQSVVFKESADKGR